MYLFFFYSWFVDIECLYFSSSLVVSFGKKRHIPIVCEAENSISIACSDRFDFGAFYGHVFSFSDSCLVVRYDVFWCDDDEIHEIVEESFGVCDTKDDHHKKKSYNCTISYSFCVFGHGADSSYDESIEYAVPEEWMDYIEQEK